MKKILFLLFVVFSLSFSQVIQKCNDKINKTAPNIRFENDDVKGITKDLQTGLTWNRCPVGKIWSASNKTCEGTNTKFSWGEALLNAKEFNNSNNNKTDITTWRLANIKELISLKENACVLPALNTTTFPNFLDGEGYATENYMWSSTTYEVSKEVFVAVPTSNSFESYTIDQKFGALLVSDTK